MILEYIHIDNSREKVKLDLNVHIDNKFHYISSSNKLKYIKEFIPAFNSGQKMVLFDSNHKQLLDFNQKNDIHSMKNIEKVNSQLLFFTSGSNGFPIGAFKTRENILKEVEVLKELLEDYTIKRVVVTVPFVHIYGVIVGLLLPLSLGNIELIVKKDFLPYELLEEASHKDTLVITTPVFIKSLGKLSDKKDLSGNVFICSTGPLDNDDITIFENLYQADLIQIFGSTETGGIAYKFSNTNKWKPLNSVTITLNDEKLSVVSPFISPYLLNKEILPISQPFTTEDLVDIDDGGFKLLGRSNKIIKIAGKRISVLQIEVILEELEGINTAIVELVYKKDLFKSEHILITLEANNEIHKKDIKAKIVEFYGTITIPFKVRYVDKINYSAMGKKVLFNHS